MRAAHFLTALLPTMALASYGGGYEGGYGGETTTIHVTSTLTGTVTNVVTATLTKSNSTSSKSYATSYAHYNTTSATTTKTSKPITFTSVTSAAPVQVTTNAAPRHMMDVALAGLAGAAMYIVL